MPELVGSNPSQSEKAEKAEKRKQQRNDKNGKRKTRKQKQQKEQVQGPMEKPAVIIRSVRKKNLHSESHHIFANIKQLMLYPFFLLTSPCSRDFGFEKQYSKTKVNV